MKSKSAREAAREVLKDGNERTFNEVADAVLAMRGVKLPGKTPRATIRKTLDRSPEFERVRAGVYRLAPEAAEPKKDEPEPVKDADEFSADLHEAAVAADAKAEAKAKRRNGESKTKQQKPKRKKVVA